MSLIEAGNGRDALQPQEQDLAGKTALITGASRGIGRAIAVNFARRGASVLGTCSSQTSMQHFESLRAELSDFHHRNGSKAPKIIGLSADVLSFETPAIIADFVKENFDGKLNVVVNNASYDKLRPMGSLDDEYVQEVLSGNTHHLVMLMDVLFRRHYIQPNSRIINISSISSRKIPFPAMYLVGATKATMEALTRSWAELLGTHPKTAGTTVNALSVGATATDALLQNAPAELSERGAKVLETGVPILGPAGMGRPEDVADVAGLIVSEKARWITGGVVCANGVTCSFSEIPIWGDTVGAN